jgi:TolB protein
MAVVGSIKRRVSVVRMAGGGLVLVAALALSTPAEAAFPGSNGRIAYTNPSGGPGQRDVFAVKPDATGKKNLTQTPNVDEVEPSYASSGSRIAYAVDDTTGNGCSQCGIWTMRSNGTHRQQLISNIGARDPAFSPDGEKIAFAKHVKGSGRVLFLMRSDGGNPHSLGAGGLNAGISWSPNGRWIVFSGGEIVKMHPNGHGLASLTSGTTLENNPDFSPDGQLIVYASITDPGTSAENGDIVVIHADGSQPEVISGSAADDVDPAFSPDGERVVYIHPYPDGATQMFTLSSAGGDFQALYPGGAFLHASPNWQSR